MITLPCFEDKKVHFDHVLYVLFLVIYIGKLPTTEGKQFETVDYTYFTVDASYNDKNVRFAKLMFVSI